MGLVIIMRGLPYSGKSKKAKELAGPDVRVHSTNDYFMVDGVYRYDVRQLRRAHAENFENFKRSLIEGVSVVVCDNCNMQIWEFTPYIDLAREFGYEIMVVVMPNYPAIQEFRRVNWRGIPEDKFFAIHAKFEPFDLEAYLATPAPAD